MKLWEVLKALEENPKKKFTSSGLIGDIGISIASKSYKFKYDDISDDIHIDMKRDWQEVKQSVTWQEAIEAWATKGKDISCTVDKFNVKYTGRVLQDNTNLGITKAEIEEGTWYIEGENNE